MRAIRACLLWLAIVPAVAPLAAEPVPAGAPAEVSEGAALGRLFYTPAQRAALDEMRRRPQRAAQEDKSPLPPPPEYVTLNGIVRRSDGATTVWLNDKQVRGRESEDGLQIAPPRRGALPGGVTVRVPQTGHVVDLKVGQQLDVNSGEVKERYRAPQRTSPPTHAEAPPPTLPQETAPARERRSSREREALRDLLREIESPAATAPPASPPPASPAGSPAPR